MKIKGFQVRKEVVLLLTKFAAPYARDLNTGGQNNE